LTHGVFGNSPGGYRIDFVASFKQTNVKTNFSRDVKRVVQPVARLPSVRASVSQGTPRTQPTTTTRTADNSKMIKVTQDQVEKLIDPDAPGFNQPERNKVEGCRKLTNWKVVDTAEGSCPICICDFEKGEILVQLSKCAHVFHQTCIVHCYKHDQAFLRCPCCPLIYGTRMGNMPKGTMTVLKSAKGTTPLSGFDCGTITITYSFESGTQGPEHRNPGAPYTGTSRTCYLPDNKEGNEVLRLLDIAFKRRLTFTVGMSVTSGADNTVVWNGVHHKTATSGGTTSYGWPDQTYFSRVKAELKDLGVE